MKLTIVVGAGASHDFGLPLGLGLKEQAARICTKFLEHQKRGGHNPDEFVRLAEVFKSIPAAANLSRLSRILTTGYHPSLDAVVADNPEFTEAARILTAKVLAAKMSAHIKDGKSPDHQWLYMQPMFNKEKRAVRNWMHPFASLIRELVNRHKLDALNIVSFNYDGILERFLNYQWSDQTSGNKSLTDFATFVYPHGRLEWILGDDRSAKISDDPSTLHFINEPGSAIASAISRSIGSADLIITLGFSFDPENVEKLHLKHLPHTTKLRYHQFSVGDKTIPLRVKNLRLADSSSFTGSLYNAFTSGAIAELVA